jgi:ABC-type dipeptide/oligopeptide/nickel transport system permease subunit
MRLHAQGPNSMQARDGMWPLVMLAPATAIGVTTLAVSVIGDWLDPTLQ